MIISFDPGYSTGIVAATEINYKTREFKISGKAIVLFPDRHKLQDILIKHIDVIEALVVEDFLLFPNKAAEQSYSRFEPVKVIERIQIYAEQLGLADKIVMQQPSERLNAAKPTGIHLAALGANRHLEAAYRHLRYYIFMQKHAKGA